MQAIPSSGAPSASSGLSAAEAEKRKAAGQVNTLPKGGENSVGAIIRRNTLTLFNLLNIALAALLLTVQSYRNMLFLGVVVSNAVIGLVQELRAKRTHDRLQLLSEGKVRVLRDGAETLLPPSELVLGDVVTLKRGDQAPADACVLEGAAEADESMLTGESEPVPKRVGDTLLSGSFLTEGTLTAELTAVGADSYAGGLQTAARKVKRPHSQLMASLNMILRVVSIALVPIGAALYLKQRFALGMAMDEAIPKTVAAMLGMIPEGLILLTSVALAVGVVRLGKRNALVNELYGIESLARVDVLCLDKTGTLTSGKMNLDGVESFGTVPRETIDRLMAAFTGAFAGDDSPTQTTLRAAFQRDHAEQAADTVAFSSERKWSAARFPTLGTLVLGAPEKTLSGPALTRAQALAERGLRVLALLRTDAPLAGHALPAGLVPVALITLGDALRPDARETLQYFEEQGVALKVISGDSPLTVSRIAGEAGLPGAEKAFDCSALAAPVDYDALAANYNVFGRVSPDDKRELVQALKRAGHTVAMTGDGVNDIPALKASDCSIAMAGGSDAACRVAQLTLLDADFSVMPQILLEGRRVINNITRASALFLVKNIFSCLLAVLLLPLPFIYPFAPIQLTLISTLTIGAPSFVLALQPNKARVRGSFLKNVLASALPGGLCVALLCVLVMALRGPLGLTEETQSTLCTLIAAFSGWCVLLDTCRPLNALRAALLVVMGAALAACVLGFPSIFYLVPLTGGALYALLGAFALTPLALWGLSRLTARVIRAPLLRDRARNDTIGA